MKRTFYLSALLVIAIQARLAAQESAAGGQAAPSTPPPADQPSGLLAPPPDNAPASAPPATTTTTATPPTPTPSTTPAAPVKLTRSELARIQREEIIRRQDLIYTANESLKAARKAEVAAEYPEARKDYLFSVEAFGSISRSTDSYATPPPKC